jgi:hypothetical protein
LADDDAGDFIDERLDPAAVFLDELGDFGSVDTHVRAVRFWVAWIF